MKTVTVTQINQNALAQARGAPTHVYKVMQVTDSLTPLIGDMLEPLELQEYCDDKHWKVIVKPAK